MKISLYLTALNYPKVKNFIQNPDLFTDRQLGKAEKVAWDFADLHSRHLINFVKMGKSLELPSAQILHL